MNARSLWGVRIRWAAVGCAVALVAGAGSIALSGATNAQLTPSKTGISPCRIMDTRASSQVGPRSTPLGVGTIHTIQVTGRNGNCSIPADATGVVLNLTVANIGADGFITVFPGGLARPTASNVNYGIFQKPVANLVNATLGSTGQLSFYAANGPVDLVADITAYTTGARLSTSDLAQRRWDRDRTRVPPVVVGSVPIDVVYDGSSLWVSNFTSNTVSKVNPVTGGVTATVTVGSQPNNMVFDGTSLWVTNGASATMSRINPATNTVIATVTLPGGFTPLGAASDGASIWVARTGASAVSKVNPATNTVVASVNVGSGPTSVTFDGTSIWVTNQTSNTLSKINPTTNTVVGTVSMGAGTQPGAAVFDGSSLWVVNSGTNTVARVDPTTNTVSTSIAVSPGARYAAFDGTSLWVTSGSSNIVTKIDPVTRAVAATVPANDPYGIVADGTSVWATNLTGGKVELIRTR